MSVSVHIHGVRKPDGALSEMLDLKELCDRLGMEYPKGLEEYFEGTEALETESRENALAEALEIDLEHHGFAVGRPESYEGALIDISKLPDDLEFIKIFMC